MRTYIDPHSTLLVLFRLVFFFFFFFLFSPRYQLGIPLNHFPPLFYFHPPFAFSHFFSSFSLSQLFFFLRSPAALRTRSLLSFFHGPKFLYLSLPPPYVFFCNVANTTRISFHLLKPNFCEPRPSFCFFPLFFFFFNGFVISSILALSSPPRPFFFFFFFLHFRLPHS